MSRNHLVETRLEQRLCVLTVFGVIPLGRAPYAMVRRQTVDLAKGDQEHAMAEVNPDKADSRCCEVNLMTIMA